MKRYIVIPIILLIILFGILTGIYIYKLDNIEVKQDNVGMIKTIEDECTAEYEYLEQIKIANAQKEKISPNTKLTTKIYYDSCGHTVKNTDIVNPNYINLTEEEFVEFYDDWKIEKFSNDEIVLNKTAKGTCNEHYILKDMNGYIAIYVLDEDENEILERVTEISTIVLPLTDSAKLKGGIKVYGRETLNSVLEDFE